MKELRAYVQTQDKKLSEFHDALIENQITLSEVRRELSFVKVWNFVHLNAHLNYCFIFWAWIGIL